MGIQREFVIEAKGDSQVAQKRPFGLWRPCSCGCDLREGNKGVGYLHGIKNGMGVSIWIENEKVFEALKQFVPFKG